MRVLIYDSGVGLLPFLSRLIAERKADDIYVYMDKGHFPLGTKTNDELLLIASQIIETTKSLNVDYLLIACNTMSYYIKQITNKEIQTFLILDYNLALLNSTNQFICSERLSIELLKSKPNIMGAGTLIKAIEENNPHQILIELKNYFMSTKSSILGCTHFEIIKPLLMDTLPFSSGFDNLISSLPSFQSSTVTFHIQKENRELFANYFPNLVLKFFIPS